MPSGKTLADAIDNFRGPEGAWVIDLLNAEHVECTVDQTNKVWINIDGRCVVRVGHAEAVVMDDPKRGQDVIGR